MIQFRCWYCGKRYWMPETRIGEHIACSCKYTLRVPRRNDGNSRVKTLTDWLVEAVVYGGAGALLGLGAGLVIISQFRGVMVFRGGSLAFIGGLTALGFLAGLFGGERGINWIGQIIRDSEKR